MRFLRIFILLSFLLISDSFQMFAYLTRGEPVLSYMIKYSKEGSDLSEMKKTIIEARIRNGFTLIEGASDFQQKVVTGSYIKPALVFFFAQKDERCNSLWSELEPLVSRVKEKSNCFAVDVFYDTEVEEDHRENQNYKIAQQCLSSGGIPFSFPSIVFFSQGMMCSSRQAVFSGNINVSQVEQLVTQIWREKAIFGS